MSLLFLNIIVSSLLINVCLGWKSYTHTHPSYKYLNFRRSIAINIVVKMLPSMSNAQVQVSRLISILYAVSVHPGGQPEMSEVLGFLLPTCYTQMEIFNSWLWPGLALADVITWEVNHWVGDLSPLSRSHSLIGYVCVALSCLLDFEMTLLVNKL